MSKKSYIGIGLRKIRGEKTLDIHFFSIAELDEKNQNLLIPALEKLDILDTNSSQNKLFLLSNQRPEHLRAFFGDEKKGFISIPQIATIPQLLNIASFTTKSKIPRINSYWEYDFVAYLLTDGSQPISSVEEAYMKLHMTSMRIAKPRKLCFDNIFNVLENIAWTESSPILIDDLEEERQKIILAQKNFSISHIDKFPYMINYYVPPGVRIANGSRVRLGAYLGEGTTVMPAGFVNYNAGTLGPAMVEGRISQGVLVGKNSDIGGGASIMGTLSGGGEEEISIGNYCLIGANAGVGISLGVGCTVEAGLYITAGAKVTLTEDFHPSQNMPSGKVVKARELSGKNNLLFFRDSTSGKILAKPNKKSSRLNPDLHKDQ